MSTGSHPAAQFIGHQVRLGFGLGSYNNYWSRAATLVDIEPFITRNPDQILYGRADIVLHEAKKCINCKRMAK